MTPETDRLFERYGPAYKWLATITVMLGTLSMTLATTIVNVAIPDIMGAFGMDQSRAQWLSTGFLASMTVFMLLSAWAQSAFGLRAAYLTAMLVFTLASVAGGMSLSEDMIILSRIVQGAMAGLLQPLAMTVIFNVFPERQRGLGMGIFGLGVILGPAVGPTLGGLLVDWFSWRAVFLLPLPTCVIGIALALLFTTGRETSGPRPGFDYGGCTLLSVSLICLFWATSNGQRLGWNSLLIQGLFLAAAVALVAFVIWELRAREPLLNVRIFAVPAFASGALLSGVVGAAIFSMAYMVPLFVQEIQQFTPTKAGLLMMPAGLTMAAMFPLAGFLSDRMQPSTLIMIGLVPVAFAFHAMSQADVNSAFWIMAAAVAIGQVGKALCLPATISGSLQTLPLPQVNQGVGAINFTRQLGGALGVNLASVMIDRRTWVHTEALAQTQTPDNAMTREMLSRFHALAERLGVSPERVDLEALRFLGEMVYRQGYALGFQDSFLGLMAVFILALIPAWLMGRFMKR